MYASIGEKTTVCFYPKDEVVGWIFGEFEFSSWLG
jgi:hypothetical protein